MNAHEVISKYRDELKYIKTLSITGDNNKSLIVSFEKAIAELNSIIDGIDPKEKGSRCIIAELAYEYYREFEKCSREIFRYSAI